MLRKVFTGIVVWMLMFGAVGSAAAAGTACTAEQGQLYIDAGRYKDAVREFTCLIEAAPTEVEGYRGRIEAELLLGLFSDAVQDYASLNAFVLPVHPDASSIIQAGYAERLAADPDEVPALMGSSFAHWWFFAYPQAITVLNHLLEVEPQNLYGSLFRGSSAMLQGINPAQADSDFQQALALAPSSPDVHSVVADGYLYGRSDYLTAFNHAIFALQKGLNTPRVHAILAAAYNSFGEQANAAAHTWQHIDLVTTELLPAPALYPGKTLDLYVVPGRTYAIPIPATAGQTIWIATSSHNFLDTIVVLLAPDGTPVLGSDDYRRYYAGFQWPAAETGTYTLLATSFEGVSTGVLAVASKK